MVAGFPGHCAPIDLVLASEKFSVCNVGSGRTGKYIRSTYLVVGLRPPSGETHIDSVSLFDVLVSDYRGIRDCRTCVRLIGVTAVFH